MLSFWVPVSPAWSRQVSIVITWRALIPMADWQSGVNPVAVSNYSFGVLGNATKLSPG
jgi:hypothetical protein